MYIRLKVDGEFDAQTVISIIRKTLKDRLEMCNEGSVGCIETTYALDAADSARLVDLEGMKDKDHPRCACDGWNGALNAVIAAGGE